MLCVIKGRTFMAKEEEYDENFSHTIECGARYGWVKFTHERCVAIMDTMLTGELIQSINNIAIHDTMLMIEAAEMGSICSHVRTRRRRGRRFAAKRVRLLRWCAGVRRACEHAVLLLWAHRVEQGKGGGAARRAEGGKRAHLGGGVTARRSDRTVARRHVAAR
jgi:hypothetical protein